MPKSVKQCNKIKKETKDKILQKSLLYFAKNGFAGTKISDLAKYIGIGQGTLYLYFESKESLFLEVQNKVKEGSNINQLKLLSKQPIKALTKIHMLSKSVISKLVESQDFAASVAINTQMTLENSMNYSSNESTYQLDLYKYMIDIIKQGQDEGTVVSGNPIKLVDYYWGVIYLYALKILFTTDFEMIEPEDLERTIVKP